jgi:hypothetical protein
LFELAEWKSQDPDVPDGDWYKDFRNVQTVAAPASSRARQAVVTASVEAQLMRENF